MLKKLIDMLQRRLLHATKYSIDGFQATFRTEEAFRMELLGLGFLIVVMLFVPWPLWKKILLPSCYLLVLLAELLNSAVEDICDLVSPEKSQLVKTAKDKGSMAVLLTLIFNFLLLIVLILV